MKTNYLQVGKGHCFICHKNYEGEHFKTCKGVPTHKKCCDDFMKDFEFEGIVYKGNRHWRKDVTKNLVKNFIQKQIDQARREERERIVEIVDDMSYCGVLDSNEKRRGYDIARVEMKEEIEKGQPYASDKAD